MGTFNKPSYQSNLGPATFHQDSWEEQGRVRGYKVRGLTCKPLPYHSVTLDTRKSFVIFKPHCSPIQWVYHSPPCLFFAVVGILGDVANTQLDGEERDSI